MIAILGTAALAASMSAGGAVAAGTARPAAVALPPDHGGGAFACDDGQRLELDHDRPAGVLRATRGGETSLLQEQVGVKPQRFVSGSDTLVLDGDTAVLRRGREARRTCRKIPDAPVEGAIWGTITKMDRMALVPGSRAKVLLVDAARQDAPHVEIASTSITTAGNQVPLTFLLRYDPGRVNPRPLTYRLMARIESPRGELLYITDAARFVLEADAPVPPAELQLVRAGNPPG